MCKLQETNLSKLQETKKFKKREPKNKLSKSSDNKLVWDDEKFMLFEELCAKFCEQKEIADIMKTSITSINTICKKHYIDEEDGHKMTFGEVQARYRSIGALKIRTKQWELIEKGNLQMLMWYGKNYLAQKENPTIDNSLEEIKNNITSLSEILIEPKANRKIK